MIPLPVGSRWKLLVFTRSKCVSSKAHIAGHLLFPSRLDLNERLAGEMFDEMKPSAREEQLLIFMMSSTRCAAVESSIEYHRLSLTATPHVRALQGWNGTAMEATLRMDVIIQHRRSCRTGDLCMEFNFKDFYR